MGMLSWWDKKQARDAHFAQQYKDIRKETNLDELMDLRHKRQPISDKNTITKNAFEKAKAPCKLPPISKPARTTRSAKINPTRN
jgi:hypothetical protein